MRLSTIILLLIRFKIGNDKKKTLKYILPTTVCFLLICTGAIIGVEIARPSPRGSMANCPIFRKN